MKKVVLFFCDISGTINGKNLNEVNDYYAFVTNIISLMKENLAENIVFSLVSTDSSEIIQKEIDLLKRFFSNQVITGKQFFEDGYIDNHQKFQTISGKPFQILNYVKELQKDYEIVKIYFADDTKIYHEILFELADYFNIPVGQIVSLIPEKSQGLAELNELIKTEYIKQYSDIKLS